MHVSNSFVQTPGETTIEGGAPEAASASLQSGDITGYGLLIANVDNSGGTVQVAGGLMEVDGNYTQGAGGTLKEDLNSGNFPDVHGDVILSGMFDGFPMTPTSLAIGDKFEILEFDGSITGDFSGFNLPALGPGMMFKEVRSGQNVMLEVDAFTPTSTPEPASLFSMGGGLLGLGVCLRRRGRRQEC